MNRTLAVGSLLLSGVFLALGVPAVGQVLVGGVPSETYAELHAWYDVNQSLGVWEGRVDQYDDEFLVDVRDEGEGSGAHRGESYPTNVETWAEFHDPATPESSWPARVGGLTGTQNGMATWEVRNAAGWDDGGGWTDADFIGTDGIGAFNGYTIFMMMNIHSAERYNSVWNGDPGPAKDDTPILNGSTALFNAEPTLGSEPGKGFIWLDKERDGYEGPQWVVDAGVELVTGAVDLNEWQVHTFVVANEDDNNGLTSHYVNGQLLGEGDAGLNPMGSLNFWNSDGGWHRAADLDFAEGIFYDQVITADDRAAIEQYLIDKWVTTAGGADFNGDGVVNGDDFLIWQGGFGGPGDHSMGDADNNGVVDGNDFLIWQAEFSPGSGSGAVPEPASALLLVAGLLGLVATRRR